MDNREDFKQKIISDFAKILADIAVHKNPSMQIAVIHECINILNELIDMELIDGGDSREYIKLSYWFYRLKEDLDQNPGCK